MDEGVHALGEGVRLHPAAAEMDDETRRGLLREIGGIVRRHPARTEHALEASERQLVAFTQFRGKLGLR
jgi:hypothetical protein